MSRIPEVLILLGFGLLSSCISGSKYLKEDGGHLVHSETHLRIPQKFNSIKTLKGIQEDPKTGITDSVAFMIQDPDRAYSPNGRFYFLDKNAPTSAAARATIKQKILDQVMMPRLITAHEVPHSQWGPYTRELYDCQYYREIPMGVVALREEGACQLEILTLKKRPDVVVFFEYRKNKKEEKQQFYNYISESLRNSVN